jgi:Fe-S-cluster containining protein
MNYWLWQHLAMGSGLLPCDTALTATEVQLQETKDMKEILTQYRGLLTEVDDWFHRCSKLYPQEISCTSGCSGCCRALFDITLLDARYLQLGFERLPPDVRQSVLAEAERRVSLLQQQWPEYSHPYLLNYRPETDWQDLMPEDDETPCLLLDDEGRCLVYEYRPMTCRLHGLPLIDVSGEVMHDEWCTENFTSNDPLSMTGLQGEFDRFFREEVRLDREFSLQLSGRVIYELDTVIPAALLIDFSNIDLDSLPDQQLPRKN